MRRNFGFRFFRLPNFSVADLHLEKTLIYSGGTAQVFHLFPFARTHYSTIYRSYTIIARKVKPLRVDVHLKKLYMSVGLYSGHLYMPTRMGVLYVPSVKQKIKGRSNTASSDIRPATSGANSPASRTGPSSENSMS